MKECNEGVKAHPKVLWGASAGCGQHLRQAVLLGVGQGAALHSSSQEKGVGGGRGGGLTPRSSRLAEHRCRVPDAPRAEEGNELQLRQEATKGHVRPQLLAKKVGWEAARRRRSSMTSPKTFLQTRRGSHLGTTFRKRDDRKHEFCLFPPITWVHMFQTKTHFSKSLLFCSSSCSCLHEAPLGGMCSWWKQTKLAAVDKTPLSIDWK